MKFLNLDNRTRELMLEEVSLDSSNGNLYFSKRLTDIGLRDYEALLKEAIQKYDYAWLANSLRMNGRMKTEEQKQKPKGGYTIARVPVTAPDTLAEGEFNRFYIRGLCRRAIDDEITELIVYRAKEVKDPRRESEAKIGARVNPHTLLNDLRTHPGVDTALGLPPGPNSGLSVRLP